MIGHASQLDIGIYRITGHRVSTKGEWVLGYDYIEIREDRLPRLFGYGWVDCTHTGFEVRIVE